MAKTKGVSIRDISEGVKSINFDIFGGIDGFLSMTSGGGGDDIVQAQQLRRVVPWLAKAVDMTANAVSALPFDILRENGEPYDTSADWKNKTGGLESPESLFYLLASSLCFGRAYLIPQLTSRAIVELQYCAPQTVREEIGRDGVQWFDRTTDKGAVARYYPIESELEPALIYFWLPDSDVELGPAQTYPAGNALLSARLLFNMDGTIATYAERGFIPPTVLGAKGMPSPAEREKAERWWDRFFRGKTDIAAKIINTEALSVVKVGAGMEDIRGAYPELTKQMIENIATAFGIPSGLFMSDMAFATEIKHLIKVWYTTSAFVKIYKSIEKGFNEQVLAAWGLKLRFNPNAIDAMQEEEMERATAFSTYVNAGMRPSVAAEMLGIELPEGVEFADLDADLAAKQQREQKMEEEAARVNAEAQMAKLQAGKEVEDNPEKPIKADGRWVTINGDHVFIDENGNPVNAPYLENNAESSKKENDQVGVCSSDSAPIYEINDASALAKDYGAIVVSKSGKEILATKLNEYHADIIESIHSDKTVDDYVRFVAENGVLTTNTASAADVDFITAETSERAVNNIYRALDIMVSRGLPGNTRVVISGVIGAENNRLDTTAKTFVSRRRERATVLNILQAGEGTIRKRTKYGFYVDMPYQKNIFIHYDEFLTEAIFDEVDTAKFLSLTAAQIKELNLWRQIAERNWRKGKGACMDFEVKSLPEDMAADIRERLKYVTGKEDIGQAFEVTGAPAHQDINVEALKMVADAINRAVDAGVNIDNPA